MGVFSQNVASLEQLNQKWRLYSKPVFKENLLAEFLSVFLQALLAKSHNLLKENRSCSLQHELHRFSSFLRKIHSSIPVRIGAAGRQPAAHSVGEFPPRHRSAELPGQPRQVYYRPAILSAGERVPATGIGQVLADCIKFAKLHKFTSEYVISSLLIKSSVL